MWWPMGKYFFRPEERDGQYVYITGTVAHHMLNVLRFQVGQDIILCDGACTDYNARLELINMKPAGLKFVLVSSNPSNTETSLPIVLYQGLVKGDKMEWIIEKCTELGVSRIIPVCTSRAVIKINALSKKTERYARIAESAAAQSMRGIVPEVSQPFNFAQALEMCSSEEIILVAHEKEVSHTLKSILPNIPPRPVVLWVGPEGGFDDSEVQALIEKGAFPICLGPRILRTETAGIVALAQIQSIWE